MAKSKTDATQRPEPTIYLGPTLRNPLLERNRVFAGGVVPAHLKDVVKDDSIKALLVPVSEAGRVRRDIKTPNTVPAKAFAALAGKAR